MSSKANDHREGPAPAEPGEEGLRRARVTAIVVAATMFMVGLDSTTLVTALPRIDVVTVSHNHYDHLDAGTVAALLALPQPAGSTARIQWVVPLGVGATLVSMGVAAGDIHELDWWGSVTLRARGGSAPGAAAATAAAAAPLPETTITCVPAQHHSARTLRDRYETLWCGFVMSHQPSAAGAAPVHVYFSGDTGLRSVEDGVAPLSAEEAAAPRCPAFEAIGARFGAIDLALLPIGAYAPRWFMCAHHLSPEDAADVHLAIRARAYVAAPCCGCY